MGMPFSLALRGRHTTSRLAIEAWEAVLTDLRRMDAIFSPYRPESWVSRYNRGEVRREDAPQPVREVWAIGELAAEESGGAFSILLGKPGTTRRLDPSGVVKGWAAERAAEHLRRLHDTDFALSAGGDIACRTLDPAASPWRIGVENPHQPSRLVAVVPVRSGGVATSGHAHRGAHVIDARTGCSPVGLASVTVVAATLTAADADATSAYAMGVAGSDWLRGRPGRVGLVVTAEGTVETFGGARSSLA